MQIIIQRTFELLSRTNNEALLRLNNICEARIANMDDPENKFVYGVLQQEVDDITNFEIENQNKNE